MAIKHSTTHNPNDIVPSADWNADHIIDGTTGEILFLTAGGNVSTDAGLFWDNVNKRLGVGTNTPSVTLEINGLMLAANFNVTDAMTAVGVNAGVGNVGTDLVAVGYNAANLNGGDDSTFMGYNSGEVNTGFGVAAFGNNAGAGNGGTDGVFMGFYSGEGNTGDYSIGVGSETLTSNTGNNVVAIGYKAGSGNAVANQFILKQTNINAIPLIQGDFATGNVGIGTTSPQGKLHVGDQATNYLKVLEDGEIQLIGTARVINHVVIHAEAFKLIGLKPVVENNEGVFITLDFVHTAEKEAYASNFIPFRWDSDTDVEILIDWLTDADGTGGDVVWGVEYLARKDNEAVGAAGTTITQAFTGAGAGLLQRSTFTTKLLKANLEADDIIGIRIFRDHDAAGDTLDLTARFLALHLHFVRNKIGKAT